MHEPILFERQHENSLRDVSFTLFRHRRKIIAFFMTVMFIVGLGTFMVPEMYESTSKLMVRLGRESVALDPTATTGQTVTVYQDRQQEINSELEILQSRELAETVVDQIGVESFLKRPDEEAFNEPTPLGVARDTLRKTRRTVREAAEKPGDVLAKLDMVDQLKKRDRAVAGLIQSLDIKTSRESNIITISYEAPNPYMAKAVVATLIEAYLEKHVDVHSSGGSYDFFSDQSKKIQDELSRTEDDLKKVKNETGIASLEEQRTIALNRMGLLQQEIERTDAALASSRARMASLEKTMKETPKTQEIEKTEGFSNVALDNMRARLFELRLREKDLTSRYTDENEQIQEIRNQIRDAEAFLEREKPALTQTRQAISDAYRQTELNYLSERAQLQSLQANAAALRRLLGDVRSEVREINENETRISDLQRERDIQVANYRKYSESLEQARIDQAMQTERLSNIAVVQSATSPMKPVRPKKMLNLALGLILGLVGGIGLAFASEYVDHTFKRPEDIEHRLNLPVLASISDFGTPHKQLSAPNRGTTAVARRA